MVDCDVHPDDGEKNWYDVIGPVYRHEKLPPDVQNNKGLIVLTTSDEVKFCPDKQFNPQILTERGGVAPVVDEWVGSLWQIAQELEMRQLKFGEWTTAGSILYPLKGKTQSVVDELFACPDDEARKQVIMRYVERSERGAAWNDVRLHLPNQDLAITE